MSASNLPLSGQRLWDSLMEMARIGARRMAAATARR